MFGKAKQEAIRREGEAQQSSEGKALTSVARTSSIMTCTDAEAEHRLRELYIYLENTYHLNAKQGPRALEANPPYAAASAGPCPGG